MRTIYILAISAWFPFAFSGCGESRANAGATCDVTPAATYKAGRGLQLTPVARDFIGLKTGEVATHPFADRAGTSAVPAEALLRTVKGDFVYVANGDWYLRTPVKVGARDLTHVEIKDGLYEGDSVVVGGMRALWLAELQAINGGVGCADDN